MDVHDGVVRLGGRRSGARVSGRLLHAKPKIGFNFFLKKNLKKKALHTSGDSAGHPVPDDPSALTPLPHYLPIPFPYSGRFSGGMVQKLRALQQPEVGS
jgi:hypothetical protein